TTCLSIYLITTLTSSTSSSTPLSFFIITPPPPRSTLFPYTTLFRSNAGARRSAGARTRARARAGARQSEHGDRPPAGPARLGGRSEEHTSELQSRFDLVCRLLLEKKKKKPITDAYTSIHQI